MKITIVLKSLMFFPNILNCEIVHKIFLIKTFIIFFVKA